MRLRLVVLAVALAPSPALSQTTIPHRTEPTMIYGLQPEPSCGKWTAERAVRSGQAVQMQSWILGFLTALNLYVPATEGNIARTADIEGFYGWLDQYCRENPLNAFTSAAMALASELQRRTHPR